MRRVPVIALAFLSVLVGCQTRTRLEPVDRVAEFIEAMGAGNTNALPSLLNSGSRVMARTNLTRRNGVAAFVMEAARSERGKNYVLVGEQRDGDHAIVFLENGKTRMGIFADPTLPPSVRKHGLQVFLVRERGQWRIDLQTTEAQLVEMGLAHLERVNKGKLPSAFPQWMPGPMGMPSPPGYKEYNPQRRSGQDNR